MGLRINIEVHVVESFETIPDRDPAIRRNVLGVLVFSM